jgi:hypothetical protein
MADERSRCQMAAGQDPPLSGGGTGPAATGAGVPVEAAGAVPPPRARGVSARDAPPKRVGPDLQDL